MTKLTIHEIAVQVEFSDGSCQSILTDDLETNPSSFHDLLIQKHKKDSLSMVSHLLEYALAPSYCRV
jgi:hypothetical protein